MPSSRTSPASSAGSSRSSTSSSLDVARRPPAWPGRRTARSRPPTAAPTRLSSGSRSSRRASTSATAVGGSASVISPDRSPPSWARRAYSTRKNGLPSVREASRPACSSLGVTSATASTTVAASAAVSPVSSSRAACRRASDSAASASAPVGSGWVRQVAEHQQPAGLHGLRSAGAAPAGWGCRPSAGRRARRRGSRRPPRRRPSRTMASQVRNSAPSSSAVADVEVGAEPAQHLLPRPERRRAVVLGAPAHEQAGAAVHGQHAELAAQAGLADARLARDRREGGAALVGQVERGLEGDQLVVTADQRPRRQRGHEPLGHRGCRVPGQRWRGRGLRRRGRGHGGRVTARAGSRPWPGPAGGRPSAASRSSTPGSRPSSTSSTSRTWRRASSASACRPARASATARRPQRRSRSGYAEVSASSSAADGPVVAEGQGGHRPVLEGHAAQLLEPDPLRHGGIGVLELDVRDPAPERERLVELAARWRPARRGTGRAAPRASWACRACGARR